MTELDEAAVIARADVAAGRRWLGSALTGLVPLPGGVSSLTYRSTLVHSDGIERDIVVKVAPPGLAAVRNRDVLRQSRIIGLLDSRPEMRVPTILFEDDGAPPLFAMTLCSGDSYEPLLDVSDTPPSPHVVNLRARAAARMLAAFHAVSPNDLGVGDEPVVTLIDEVDRWARLFDTVDESICPGHLDLRDRLRAEIPHSVAARLVHGDYRLANMLFDGHELTAVIDWEIWSVGDPRTDLAWLFMHCDPAHVFHETRSAADRAAGEGMPGIDALADEYLSVGGDDELLATVDWFLALSLYKTASTISVLVKRNRRRSDPDPTLEVAASHLTDLIARGHDALGRYTAGVVAG